MKKGKKSALKKVFLALRLFACTLLIFSIGCFTISNQIDTQETNTDTVSSMSHRYENAAAPDYSPLDMEEKSLLASVDSSSQFSFMKAGNLVPDVEPISAEEAVDLQGVSNVELSLMSAGDMDTPMKIAVWVWLIIGLFILLVIVAIVAS